MSNISNMGWYWQDESVGDSITNNFYFEPLVDNEGVVWTDWEVLAGELILTASGSYLIQAYPSDGTISEPTSFYIFIGNDAPSTSAPALSATPTASTVLVNGESIAFDAFLIAGNNYFKLRDLAFILNGTEKQFEVGWDGVSNAISLTIGQPYTVVGGEMESTGGGVQTPSPTDSKILLNGVEVSLTAYNINGNNYFKLRDIGAAFDFGVDWDGAANTIVINTSNGYTPEG